MDRLAVAVAFVDRIDMDRQEYTAVGFVGDRGTILKTDISVVVAGHDDIDLGIRFGDLVVQTVCDIEYDSLLVGQFADASAILAAMTGVDYNDKGRIVGSCQNGCRETGHNEKYYVL